MASRPFFAIKTREKTRTENGTEFLYSKKREVSNSNIISAFQARMITSPSDFREPGFYTWIMKQGKSGPVKLYALRTLSKQEIGTLHSNLNLYSNDPDPIIAAGELQFIEPNTIKFNLLSGTFMVPIFSRLSGKGAELELKKKLIEKFIKLFENTWFDVEFLECGNESCSEEEKSGGKKLIEGTNIRTPLKNLKFLRDYFSSPINAEINARSGGRRTRKKHRRHKTRKTKSKK